MGNQFMRAGLLHPPGSSEVVTDLGFFAEGIPTQPLGRPGPKGKKLLVAVKCQCMCHCAVHKGEKSDGNASLLNGD